VEGALRVSEKKKRRKGGDEKKGDVRQDTGEKTEGWRKSMPRSRNVYVRALRGKGGGEEGKKKPCLGGFWGGGGGGAGYSVGTKGYVKGLLRNA